jgi:hypothetical protein
MMPSGFKLTLVEIPEPVSCRDKALAEEEESQSWESQGSGA